MPTNSRTSPTERLLAGLSARQREAVTHTDGPLLIVAGPGSGKTRVMAHRVAYLVGEKGIRPWKILAVTFTNKAARELRERCERLVGHGSDELQVRTFHGFCSRVLRSDGEHVGLKPEFTIYDDDDTDANKVDGVWGVTGPVSTLLFPLKGESSKMWMIGIGRTNRNQVAANNASFDKLNPDLMHFRLFGNDFGREYYLPY